MALNIVAIIPSLNPDEKLLKCVSDLKEQGFDKIIVVNDGSNDETKKYFDKLDTIVLNHEVNLGKGKALKTAFKYYLSNFKNYDGVVTVDSDGQHKGSDAYEVAKYIETNTLVLGVRNFKQKNVPFKSRYGNIITTFIFKILYGKKINDTQTGLRGIPNDFIKKIINLNGSRFEYEINVLKYAIKEKVLIKEVMIKTIYIKKNKSSHFKVFKDSFKIYKEMIKR